MIPNYLLSAYNFTETAGVTDVSATITRIKTKALLVGWTNPSGDTLVSPADASSRQITVAWSRISATNLQMVFTDGVSRTFTRRAQHSGTFNERIACNAFGIFVDFSNGEGMWASLLDPTPQLLTAHNMWGVGHGARTAADSLDGLFAAGGAMQLDHNTPRVFVPIEKAHVQPRGNRGRVANFTGYSYAGSRLWYPFIHHGPQTSGNSRVRGRLFQAVLVHSNEADGAEFPVTVDQSTSVLFKILSFPTAGTGTSEDNCRLAVRKA